MIDFTEPMPLKELEPICKTRELTKEDWINISQYQLLDESFIEQYKDKVDLQLIPEYQKLSEVFIEKHKDEVDWGWICYSQDLSEAFIEKFKDKVEWDCISEYQKLSEVFIEKFKDKVDWRMISQYQKLSEPFIEKYKNKVNWSYISRNQKLSDGFIKKYADKINFEALEKNWLYKPMEFKRQQIINSGLFECHETYFIGYKKVRKDRYGLEDFQHRYKKKSIIIDFLDHIHPENRVKLHVSSIECIIQCKIYYKDVIEIYDSIETVYCNKLTVLS